MKVVGVNNMSEYKRIHFHLFDPSTRSIFGNNKNDKAEIQVIRCNNSENCDLFKRGQCSMRSSFGSSRCSYGKYSREVGFTKRARKFYDWINKKKEEYAGIPDLNNHSEKIAFVGDFVFLPYAHMTMCKNAPFQAKANLGSNGIAFIPKEDFTIETIMTLIDARPQAFFGGEIWDYQKEVVPKFVWHLKEVVPEMFEELKELSEKVRDIEARHTSVGREAMLRSVVPNVGLFTDIHGGDWVWDGEWLTGTNSHASFMLVSKFSEIKVKPIGDHKVKITDNDQVDENTVLLD